MLSYSAIKWGIVNFKPKWKLHSLNSTEIHFSPLTLFSFNYSKFQIYSIYVFCPISLKFSIKKVFLSHEKKFIKLIKVFYKKFMWEMFFFPKKNLFSLVNCINNSKILMKFDKKLKLNKFET